MAQDSDNSGGGVPEAGPKRPCALLGEASFLWGVIARRALSEAGLPFDLLGAEAVRQGALDRYRLLFVPGGWASNRIGALGDRGMARIREFVEGGGNYLGICGGAGLATREGLGLLPVDRAPRAERVPSFSGPIGVDSDDPLLQNGVGSSVFHAWWPSQFRVGDPAVRILATYGRAQPGAFSADIPVEDVPADGWPPLEADYGIRLDPGRLTGEPAVVAGRCGRGRVLLSLLHFDTPGDPSGAAVLRNLWDVLAPGGPAAPPAAAADPGRRRGGTVPPAAWQTLGALEEAVADWVATGERHFLWSWRTPWLLRWRRGVRGLECSTLVAMIAEIRRCLELLGPAAPADLAEALEGIRLTLLPFVAQAKHLLVRERFHLQTAPLSPLNGGDETTRALRAGLFGREMHHGGAFKRLIDAIDALLQAWTSTPAGGARKNDPR